jgi:hypothetical protein
MLIVCLLVVLTGYPQPDSATVYQRRRVILSSSSGIFAAATLTGLHFAWYKQYNTGKFHFFNDNAEWLQMDKAGHVFAAYQSGRLMMDAFEWAGYSRRSKLLIGGTMGSMYLTVVEIMDGYSSGWGFSWGDQCANLFGSALAISQEAAWKEQKFQLKFSYAPSGMARYNPSLLGENIYTRVLKDYNAQVYWLSFNPVSLFNSHTKFPQWLHVAFGYSAHGMTGGHSNSPETMANSNNMLLFERRRQFLFSLDIDLTEIPTKSPFLKTLFSVINIVKFPAPAILIDRQGQQLRFL